MRDVQSGWIIRYTHANVASFFFIFVYAQVTNININLYNLQLNYWTFITESYTETKTGTGTKNNCIKDKKNRLIKSINLYNITKFLLNTIVLIKKIIEEFLNIKDSTIFNHSKASPRGSNSNGNGPHHKGTTSTSTERGGTININNNSEFLQWFVGFSDAESSFMISLRNNSEVHFIFQISLHIEDCAVLYTIREKLGVGVVSIKNNTCSYRVCSFQNILNVILPIFDKYPLLTFKQLDYKDWRKAVLLKKKNQEYNNSLSLTEDNFKQFSDIKYNMNSNRTEFNNYNLKKEMISKYWLVGFVEGDGSFYFSNGNAVFSLTQKDKKILEVIAEYLKNIPLSPPALPPCKNLFKPSKPHCAIASKNNNSAYQLDIQDKDVLFQYIFPFFKDLQFYTRKSVDFSIWSLGLHIFIHGYNHVSKGKELLLKLTNNMNSKRYFTDLSELLDTQEIKELFSIEPPFDIYSGKSHFLLSKEFNAKKGSRKGYKLYVYKNGIQIEGSPFHSYRKGCKVLGIISPSSIKNYIDTGKIYNEYTFYSSGSNSPPSRTGPVRHSPQI